MFGTWLLCLSLSWIAVRKKEIRERKTEGSEGEVYHAYTPKLRNKALRYVFLHECFLKKKCFLFRRYHHFNRFYSSSAVSQVDPFQMCFSVSRLVENDHRLTSGMCSGLSCGPSFQKRWDKIIQNYYRPAFWDILSERLTVKHQHMIKVNITTNRHCDVYTTQISYINQICFRPRLWFVLFSSRYEFTQRSLFIISI